MGENKEDLDKKGLDEYRNTWERYQNNPVEDLIKIFNSAEDGENMDSPYYRAIRDLIMQK